VNAKGTIPRNLRGMVASHHVQVVFAVLQHVPRQDGSIPRSEQLSWGEKLLLWDGNQSKGKRGCMGEWLSRKTADFYFVQLLLCMTRQHPLYMFAVCGVG
jgi:hypothetical protein